MKKKLIPIVSMLLLLPTYAISGEGLSAWDKLGAGTLADADMIPITDVSDTTQSAEGSSKTMTATQMAAYVATKITDATLTTTDVTTNNASTTKHGWFPKLTEPSSGYLNVYGLENGETAATAKGLFDATVPSTQAAGDSAATGSAMSAARRDHKHAMPAAQTATTTVFTPNGSIAATNVQAAIQEVRDEASGEADNQIATEVPFTPNGSIAASNVQAAIQEVRDEAGSGHTEVTINATANGLSVDGSQVITLAAASSGQTGALTSGDWSTFNGKQAALTNPIVAAGAQSITGAKTFDKDTLVTKGTSTGVTTISNANTGSLNYTATLQAGTGTIAYTSDITGSNSGTNTGDNATNTQYSGLITSKTANYVFAAPNGSAGTPSFRALVAADIPALSYQAVLTNPLVRADIDDTPVNGEVTGPISSNWAYDHAAAADPHAGYVLESAIGSTVLAPNGSGASLTSLPSQVSDTAYDATTWDSVTTTAPSKNAVRDYLESRIATGSDGDRGLKATENTIDYSAEEAGYFVYTSKSGSPKYYGGTTGYTLLTGTLGYTFSGTLTGNTAVTFPTSGTLLAGTAGVAAGNILTLPTDPAAHTLFGFDNTTNTYKTILIGLNLSYDQPTNTLSASGVGGLASTDIDTSSELDTIVGDDVGSGYLVFNTAPTFVTSIAPTSADGATLGTTALEWSDIYLAAGGVIYGENGQENTITSSSTGWNFNLPIGLYSANDPDVAAEGKMSWDANGDYARVHDGTNQVAVARAKECYDATVVKPNDLADATRDAFRMWQNNSGMSFIITSWSAQSSTDNTDLNIETTTSSNGTNATVDAVSITTDGTSMYYASDSTITAGTIANGSILWLDFDDTDDPGWVGISICGYYDGNVN